VEEFSFSVPEKAAQALARSLEFMITGSSSSAAEFDIDEDD
jgi:hypothetical protein